MRRFFSSAVSLMVRVDHLPLALLGLRPLGFLPLTTPLPRTNDWLSLFHYLTSGDIYQRWIPTTVARSSTCVKPIKQASVKVDTSRTLSLSVNYFGWIFHKREPTINRDIIWVIHHRQGEKGKNLFNRRVFPTLQNFVVGQQGLSHYVDWVVRQINCRV